MTGLRKLSEMGGLYKTMPITLGLYMVGAFAISAVPLFSGFVSKSMVVSAAGESHRAAIFLMLTLASAGTFLHTGLKLPYYMFFGKDSRPARPRAAREHARGHGPGCGRVRAHRRLPRALVLAPSVSRGLRSVHRAARHVARSGCWASRRSGSSCCSSTWIPSPRSAWTRTGSTAAVRRPCWPCAQWRRLRESRASSGRSTRS